MNLKIGLSRERDTMDFVCPRSRMPMPVVLRSKWWVCSYWITGIANSNSAEDIYGSSSLMFVACCVGSGPCDRLITPVEQFHRVFVSN